MQDKYSNLMCELVLSVVGGFTPYSVARDGV